MEQSDQTGYTTSKARVVTPGDAKTPAIDDAISDIERYEFDPYQEEDESLALMMMYGNGMSAELPTVRTEGWPYTGQKPNPISINKARLLLAAAYESIPCDIAGAGRHGFSWIAETDETWLKRDGATYAVIPPDMPEKEMDYSTKKQMQYQDKLRAFTLYNHLIQEGKAKIIEWFGKPMFVDLQVNGLLPSTKTPNDLLEHLTKTYAQGRAHRRYLAETAKSFNAPYNPKEPVEAYFMRLQDARSDAELLGQPYTDTQVMNQAIVQFELQHGKDAAKASTKWDTKTTAEQTWTAFKEYWKTELELWESYTMTNPKAHNAVQEQVDDLSAQVSSMQFDMTALQSENQSYKEANSVLIAQQAQFHQALQAGQQRQHRYGDDISTITDILTGLDRKVNSSTSGSGPDTATTLGTDHADEATRLRLLARACQRAPDAFKRLNDGQGKKFNKYCFKCGVNCTHWTSGCLELTPDQKSKYRNASFDNLMGGSRKFIERRGKYQKEFNFDSL